MVGLKLEGSLISQNNILLLLSSLSLSSSLLSS